MPVSTFQALNSWMWIAMLPRPGRGLPDSWNHSSGFCRLAPIIESCPSQHHWAPLVQNRGGCRSLPTLTEIRNGDYPTTGPRKFLSAFWGGLAFGWTHRILSSGIFLNKSFWQVVALELQFEMNLGKRSRQVRHLVSPRDTVFPKSTC